MSDEIRKFIDQQLPHSLKPICRVQNPAAFFYRAEPVPPMREGQISVSQGGEIFAPWDVAEVMAQDLRRLGMHVEFDFASNDTDRTQDVKFTLQPPDGPVNLYRYVAPWYVELYCKAPGTDPETGRILLHLKDFSEKGEGRFIFRGESDLYPSVRSTLARYWNTDSSDALRIISENNLDRARQYFQDAQLAELDIFALIQHMGGITNLVDFSIEIWIALFFACLDDGTPPRNLKTGRVYALDLSENYEDMEIHSLERLSSPIPQDRWERQAGVAVIPSTGTVSSNYLHEVAKIEADGKRHLNNFLDGIGISNRTLFNDLEGYIRYEQDSIPIGAICHMVMSLLRTGGHNRASHFAESLIRQDDEINEELGYYFRGLCHAFEGKLKQANQDINKFVEMRQSVPKCVEANTKLLRETLRNNRNRDYGRKQRRQLLNLQKQIRLDCDKELWSVTLEGYTFVQR